MQANHTPDYCGVPIRKRSRSSRVGGPVKRAYAAEQPAIAGQFGRKPRALSRLEGRDFMQAMMCLVYDRVEGCRVAQFGQGNEPAPKAEVTSSNLVGCAILSMQHSVYASLYAASPAYREEHLSIAYRRDITRIRQSKMSVSCKDKALVEISIT